MGKKDNGRNKKVDKVKCNCWLYNLKKIAGGITPYTKGAKCRTPTASEIVSREKLFIKGFHISEFGYMEKDINLITKPNQIIRTKKMKDEKIELCTPPINILDILSQAVRAGTVKDIEWDEADLKPLIVEIECDICEEKLPHLIIGEYAGYDILRCFKCRVLTTQKTESKEVRRK